MMDKGAQLSPCRTWRYSLWRIWNPSLPVLAFVGLNPSDDTLTLRRE